jgi:hypothetical protein
LLNRLIDPEKGKTMSNTEKPTFDRAFEHPYAVEDEELKAMMEIAEASERGLEPSSKQAALLIDRLLGRAVSAAWLLKENTCYVKDVEMDSLREARQAARKIAERVTNGQTHRYNGWMA